MQNAFRSVALAGMILLLPNAFLKSKNLEAMAADPLLAKQDTAIVEKANYAPPELSPDPGIKADTITTAITSGNLHYSFPDLPEYPINASFSISLSESESYSHIRLIAPKNKDPFRKELPDFMRDPIKHIDKSIDRLDRTLEDYFNDNDIAGKYFYFDFKDVVRGTAQLTGVEDYLGLDDNHKISGVFDTTRRSVGIVYELKFGK